MSTGSFSRHGQLKTRLGVEDGGWRVGGGAEGERGRGEAGAESIANRNQRRSTVNLQVTT